MTFRGVSGITGLISKITSRAVDGSGNPLTDIRGDGYFRAANKLKCGTVNVSVTSSTTGTATYTFTNAFPAGSNVRVIPIVRGSSVWMAYLSSTPSTTSFTVGVRQVQGTSTSATVIVDWIAMVDD